VGYYSRLFRLIALRILKAEHLTISIGEATTTDVYGAELLHRLIEQADRVVFRKR